MKVLILANPISSHSIKWVNSLSEKGVEVYLFGLNSYNKNSFNKEIKIEIFDIPQKLQSNTDGSFSKIIYLLSINKLKKFIKKIKPDIVHAHYVSSYGILGALTGFHPFFISVWGTDIYYIPEKNIIYRKLIEFSLNKADKILSTSRTMAAQTRKYTKKEIEVVPFGIDTDKFRPMKTTSLFNEEDIVVGTIKTLEKKYGIEYLIRSFKLIKQKLPYIQLKLLIVGGGSLEDYLKKLVEELEIKNDVTFTGFVIPEKVSQYHNMIDIFAALSIEDSESFGVSTLEASACEKPVVVSNVSGFTEVIENNISGYVVERKNIQQTSEVLIKLVLNKKLREEMGNAGRKNVQKFYDWTDNVEQMIDIYKKFFRKIL